MSGGGAGDPGTIRIRQKQRFSIAPIRIMQREFSGKVGTVDQHSGERFSTKQT